MRAPVPALALLLVGLSGASAAGAATGCPGGRFLVRGASPGLASRLQVVVVDGARVALSIGCGPVTGKVRRTRAGFRERATWRDCGGLAGKIALKALIARDCATLHGILVARRSGVRDVFNAPLSRCGDGIVDAGSGEACEVATGCAPGERCSASCVCEPVVTPGTTTVPGVTTTSTTATVTSSTRTPTSTTATSASATTATTTTMTVTTSTATATSTTLVSIELTWDQSVDMDLQLARGAGTPFSMTDDGERCFWGNRNPDWGTADPTLVTDDIAGCNPELITLTGVPASGSAYTVYVHYYCNRRGHRTIQGDPSTVCYETTTAGAASATVKVSVDGAVASTLSNSLLQGQVWTATILSYDSSGGWQVVPDGALGAGPVTACMGSSTCTCPFLTNPDDPYCGTGGAACRAKYP